MKVCSRRTSGWALAWAVGLFLASCATTPPPAKPANGPELRIGGYFASSDIYKRDYQVADAPTKKMTHLFYAFLKIEDDFTVGFVDKNADVLKKIGNEPKGLTYRGNFAQLQLAKAENPRLKVIPSIGGGTLSEKYSELVSKAALRKVFVESAVTFVRTYGMDGVDIDWEFPVEGGVPGVPHSPDDGRNLTKLIQELRKAFDAAGVKDGKAYEVGLTVSPNPGYGKFLESRTLGGLVDFFNLMTYDYHGPWDKMTFHLAPLYANPADPGYRWAAGRKLNVAGAVQYYLDEGVPASKINVGIPLYGMAWQTAPKSKAPLFSPTVDKATLKPIGVLDYAEVQTMISKGLHPQWDEDSHAPYLYDADTGLFVSYDDGRSVTEKLELVVGKKLGGIFYWKLSQDRGGDLVNYTTWSLGRALASKSP